MFATHQHGGHRRLRSAAPPEGRGFLLVPWGTSFFAHSGLPLIGLGYPSIAYSTFDPAMEMWKKMFPELPPDQLNKTFNNVGTFALDDIPAPRWQPIYTVAPVAPFTKPGLTICDLIRPSRAAMAASIGCPPPVPASAPVRLPPDERPPASDRAPSPPEGKS